MARRPAKPHAAPPAGVVTLPDAEGAPVVLITDPPAEDPEDLDEAPEDDLAEAPLLLRVDH